MLSKYRQDCELGRIKARLELDAAYLSDNIPRIVRLIREASSDDNPVSTGFLFEVVQRAMRP